MRAARGPWAVMEVPIGREADMSITCLNLREWTHSVIRCASAIAASVVRKGTDDPSR
jgi:hypothetical protein